MMSPYIQSVIDDSPDALREADLEASQEELLGLSLLDLAKFLQKENVLRAFQSSESFPTVKIKDSILNYTREDFEKHLQIKYAHVPVFKNIDALISVLHQNKSEFSYVREMNLEDLPKKDVHFQIRWIDEEMGFGVFALSEFKSNCLIGEYTGLFEFGSLLGDYGVYLFNDISINAQVYGNFTRYINHSYTPNLQAELVFLQGLPRIFLWTGKEIKKGSQLSLNYGKGYWEQIGKTPKEVV